MSVTTRTSRTSRTDRHRPVRPGSARRASMPPPGGASGSPDGPDGCDVRAEMVTGVGVVTVDGPLSVQALPACHAAVDGLLRHRPNYVVLDLSRAVPTDASVAVLGLLRRRIARHGVRLGLAAVPRALVESLDAGQVTTLYSFHPRLVDAVDAVAGKSRLGRPHLVTQGG